MATIKPAVVSIIINSSYVLISTTPSTRLEAGGKRPPSCLGKYIIQFLLVPPLTGAGEVVCFNIRQQKHHILPDLC